VFMICHAFFGLDEIGDEIEEPFGIEPQDLPLAAISRTIEINLLQYLDEPDVPPMLEPVGRVLQ
jgi:putative membrane protein